MDMEIDYEYRIWRIGLGLFLIGILIGIAFSILSIGPYKIPVEQTFLNNLCEDKFGSEYQYDDIIDNKLICEVKNGTKLTNEPIIKKEEKQREFYRI